MPDIRDIVLEKIVALGYSQLLVDGFDTPYRAPRFADIPSYLTRKKRGQDQPTRTQRWVQSVEHFQQGWWSNQSLAGEYLGEGYNIVQTTDTASGKTTPHIGHALHLSDYDANSRSLFLYTTKSLLIDQEEKLKAALEAVGEPLSRLGILNGDVEHGQARFDILKRSKYLLATPDIFHTFVLANLDNKDVQAFMRNLMFQVVDEGHLYNGILGNNAPYLFRRIEFARDVLRGVHTKGPNTDRLQTAVASASLRDVAGHMQRMTGKSFVEIGQKDEGAEKHEKSFMHMASEKDDDIGMAKKFLIDIIREIKSRQAQNQDVEITGNILCFIESRQLVEKLAEAINRETDLDITRAARSGYTREDHQEMLHEINVGKTKVILSTSYLQAGVDFPHMSVVIFCGPPTTPGSMHQSFSRGGRHGPALCIAIAPRNEFRSRDQTFRQNLEYRITPPSTGTDDPRVPLANALCLVHEARLLGLDTKTLDINQARYHWPKPLAGNNDLPATVARLQSGHILPDADFAARVKTHIRTPHSIISLRSLTKQRSFDLVVTSGDVEKVIGHVDQRQAVHECGPGMFYRQGGRYVTGEWLKPDKTHRKWRIPLRETKRIGDTFALLDKFVNVDTTSKQFIPRRVSGRHGNMVECPLHVTERYRGYSYFRTESREDARDISGSDEEKSDRSPYACYTRTSGVVLEFNDLEFERGELYRLSRYIKESLARVLHIAPQEIDTASRRIYRGTKADGKPNPVESSIAIFDTSGDGLRFTSALLDNIQAVTSSMVEMHPDDDVVPKFMDFVASLKTIEEGPQVKTVTTRVGIAADFAVAGDRSNNTGAPRLVDTNAEIVDVFPPGTPVWYTPPVPRGSTEAPKPVMAVVREFNPPVGEIGRTYRVAAHPQNTVAQNKIFRERGGRTGVVLALANQISRELSELNAG